MAEQSSGDRITRQGRPRWVLEDGADVESFGNWLRKQREARDIALEDIAEHTKISSGILQALESDNQASLPAPVFLRGFLRQYARYVGLDPELVVSYYAGQEGGGHDRESRIRAEQAGKAIGWRWLGALLVVAAAAGGYYWFAIRPVQPDSNSPVEFAQRPADAEPQPALTQVATPPESEGRVQQPAPQDEVEMEAEPQPAVAEPSALEPSDGSTPIRLTIDFVEDCWVESSVDGRRQISTLYAKGESLRLEADERVRVFLGNFSGAVVQINGRPYVWPAGEPGESTRELIVDQDFLAQQTGETGPSDEATSVG